MANRRGGALGARPGLTAGLLVAAIGLAAPASADPAATDAAAPAQGERLTDPLLGDADAIAEGRRIYRSRCVICHGREGGRGPNLFAARLDDEAFLETVIQGRRTMPALGLLMSPDDVWAVHAYVKSTDHYE